MRATMRKEGKDSQKERENSRQDPCAFLLELVIIPTVIAFSHSVCKICVCVLARVYACIKFQAVRVCKRALECDHCSSFNLIPVNLQDFARPDLNKRLLVNRCCYY